MPRKTKLTPKLQEDIVQALNVGATHALACQFAGIHPDTFYVWLKKGEDGRAPYAEFSEAVKKAEGQAAVGWLALINAAARAGTWQSAAWLLERKFPKMYGRRADEVADAGPITLLVKYEDASETARERLDARLTHLSQRHTEDAMPEA